MPGRIVPENRDQNTVDTVVLGAGIGGLSVGYALARRGQRVRIFERGASLGTGASGKNAGMGRQAVADPALVRLARDTLAMVRDFQGGADGPLLRSRGSFLLHDDIDEIDRLGEHLKHSEIPFAVDDGPVPAWLAGTGTAHRLYVPSDATLDSGGILEEVRRRFLTAGGVLSLGEPVEEVRVDGSGSISGVRSRGQDLSCAALVDARGAFAGRPLPGLPELGLPALVARRRHLALGISADVVSLDDPWVWDLSGGAYCRPEPGGALLCACDEEVVPPETELAHPDALEWIAQRTKERFPALGNVRIRTHWAGLRTFSEDEGFVLGGDPRLPGFVWMAGLGGHGMSAGLAAGFAVAEEMCSGRLPSHVQSLAASRFQQQRIEKRSATS